MRGIERPDDGIKLAGTDVQRNIIHRDNLIGPVVRVAERFAHIAQGQNGHEFASAGFLKRWPKIGGIRRSVKEIVASVVVVEIASGSLSVVN